MGPKYSYSLKFEKCKDIRSHTCTINGMQRMLVNMVEQPCMLTILSQIVSPNHFCN